MTYICPELPGKYFDIIFYLRVDDKYLPENFQANSLILYQNFETVDENIYKWSYSELLLALKDNIVKFQSNNLCHQPSGFGRRRIFDLGCASVKYSVTFQNLQTGDIIFDLSLLTINIILYGNFETVDKNISKWSDIQFKHSLKDKSVYC